MKKISLILFFLFFTQVVAQEENVTTTADGLVGKIVKITGNVQAFGVVKEYQAGSYIVLASLDGQEESSLVLAGAYRIEILAQSKDEYQQRESRGEAVPSGEIIEYSPEKRDVARAAMPVASSSGQEELAKEDLEAKIYFWEAKKKNNKKAYEKVIKKYPQSAVAKEAQRRIEEPVYSFIQTIQIFPLEDAFAGFEQMHPNSEMQPIINSYYQFIKRKKTDFENPWAKVLRFCIPAVHLKMVNARVGIKINMGKVYAKGLLGSFVAPSSAAKAHKKLAKWVSAPLAKQGVPYVMIAENSPEAPCPDITHLVEISYSEEKGEKQQMEQGAVTTILGGVPVREKCVFSITNIVEKKALYTNLKENVEFEYKERIDFWDDKIDWWQVSNSYLNIDWEDASERLGNDPLVSLASLIFIKKSPKNPAEIDIFEKEARQIIADFLAKNRENK